MEYLWLVLLAILGVAMVIKPELLWRIEHIFTVKDGEPTELYLAFMRLGGGVHYRGHRLRSGGRVLRGPANEKGACMFRKPVSPAENRLAHRLYFGESGLPGSAA